MNTQRFVITLLIVVVVGAAAVAGANLLSRYLLSKLDGTGGVSAPASTTLPYASEDGVSFEYPDTYRISSHTEGNEERQWDVLVLLPKDYVPPEAGEGPPAITMSVFDNPEGLSLEQWITSDARSNWKLAAQDGGLGSTRVGGEPALAYRYSGLYETSATAVAHRGKIFIFTVGWLTPEDSIRAEFEALLESVSFR